MTASISVLRAYKTRAGAGKRLANELGANIVVAGRYPDILPKDLVLNWGRSVWPVWTEEALDGGVSFINQPSAIAKAVNKTVCFKYLDDGCVRTLRHTTSREEAERLAESDPVFCRTLISASQGKGIVIARNPSEVVEAPLYTMGYPKTDEFRIHVFNGEVIDRTQKKRRSLEKLIELGLTYNGNIRNMANGSVFCRHDIFEHNDLDQLGIDAVKALGLDFGGVDIMAIIKDGELLSSVVCEVNTAPQLQGTTMTRYVEAINKFTGNT